MGFGTTWVDFQGTVLSEVSQTEQGKYCMMSLICELLKKVSQTQKQNVEQWLSGAEGLEEIERHCLKGTNFQLQNE